MNFARSTTFIGTSVLGLILLCAVQAGAQTREEKLAAASQVFKQAEALFNQGTPESMQAAIPKFETACKQFRDASSKPDEANCISWIAYSNLSLGKDQVALDHYNQSLPMFRQLGDKVGEATILTSMGTAYVRLGEGQRAIDLFILSLPLLRASNDNKGEATADYNIGATYIALGQNQKALEFLNKALGIWRAIADKTGEFTTLVTMAAVYSASDDKRKVLEYINQALPLAKLLGDKTAEAEMVKQAAGIYYDLGDKQKAIEFYLRAIALFREAGDKKSEGTTLYFIGGTYSAQGDNRKAIEYLNLALPIFQATSDSNMQASSLFIIGTAHFKLGEKQKAVEALNLALPLFQQVDNKEFVAMTSETLGVMYADLGENTKAIAALEQSLLMARQVGDSVAEATALGRIGAIRQAIGENKKALEDYTLARSLFKKAADIEGEASALLGIGDVHHSLGENQKALAHYELALPLYLQAGNKGGEAMILRHIGEIYGDLRENEKALGFYARSLPLEREIKDPAAEADTLNNMGHAYLGLGQMPKALESWNQALSLWRQTGDKRGEAVVLGNLGSAYLRLGEWEKALDFQNQALPLTRAAGDAEGEANIVDNIGQANFALGRNKIALESFDLALRLRRQIGDKEGEAVTLSNMMTASRIAPLAIYFGKQSVNCLQQLRRNIDGFDQQSQQTYLRSVEGTFGALAELLILEGRLPEAQQVLNSFKDQQFFDLDKTQAKQPLPLALTRSEEDFTARYELASVRASAIRQQLEDLKGKFGNRELNTDEKAQIQKIESEMKTAENEFTSFFRQAEIEFSKPVTEKDKIAETRDLTEMQKALRVLSQSTGRNAVAAYQLVGTSDFHVLLITPDRIKAVSVPVTGKSLNERAKEFWALLRSDKYDPRPVGKELYDIVFKSLEKELPAGTKTILWSLDGNLRYIPMAALFDGERYLVERFDNITFTRADSERLIRAVSPKWSASAFGTSKPRVTYNLGTQISFAALPGVGAELDSLFSSVKKAAIVDGEILLDDAFTRKEMLARLQTKRPVVHIASHFSFRPGDETRSFLLMGDGTAFTLADMKKQKDMFAGVELLTLSACNTAAQQADANGREVDAFFELAQRLGANSVMATLWPVADNSTPWLMREFYDLKVNKHQNKAEALRNAQLALLNGSAKAARSMTRSDASGVKIIVAGAPKGKMDTRADQFVIEKKDAKPYLANPKKPFAHPFYWSPFVLIGNWR